MDKILFRNPAKYLALSIFGDDEPRSVRKIEAWAAGETRLTVKELYEIYLLMPGLDLALTLKDLHDRYSLSDYRRVRKQGSGDGDR